MCVCTKAGVFKCPPFVNHLCVRYIESQVFLARVCVVCVCGGVFTKGVSLFHSCMYQIGAVMLGTRNVGCTHTDFGAQRDNLRTMVGVLTRIMIYMHGEFTHARGIHTRTPGK